MHRIARRTAALLAVSGALAVAAQPEQLSSAGKRRTVEIAGEVFAGQSFEHEVAPGLMFALVATSQGWEIVVQAGRGDENLARLTPPLHGPANPRMIEGWHLRNADNSGPNEAGPRNVNAPGVVRDFIFSPAVGVTIDGPDARRAPTPEEIGAVAGWGKGVLQIVDYELTDLGPGLTARFARMRFTVRLTVPAQVVRPR